MTSRRFKFLIALCLLLLLLVQPRHETPATNTQQPLRVDFSEYVQQYEASNQKTWTETVRWNDTIAWAAALPPPTTAPRREGNQGAMDAQAVDDGSVWHRLALCESGGNPAANTGNGFQGAFQFTQSTWDSMGTGYAHAYDAPYEVQLDAAQRLQARSGWGQWPACARKLGLL